MKIRYEVAKNFQLGDKKITTRRGAVMIDGRWSFKRIRAQILKAHPGFYLRGYARAK